MFTRRRPVDQKSDRFKQQQESKHQPDRNDSVPRLDGSKEMHEPSRVNIQTAMEWAVLGGD